MDRELHDDAGRVMAAETDDEGHNRHPDRGLDRYTVFVEYRYGPEPDDFSIEEIDVDAVSRDYARELAEEVLEADYEPGGKITRIEQRFGLYL